MGVVGQELESECLDSSSQEQVGNFCKTLGRSNGIFQILALQVAKHRQPVSAQTHFTNGVYIPTASQVSTI